MPDERLPYLFAVYAVTWVVFFIYSFFLTRHQHEMEREIRSLRRELDLRQGGEEREGAGEHLH